MIDNKDILLSEAATLYANYYSEDSDNEYNDFFEAFGKDSPKQRSFAEKLISDVTSKYQEFIKSNPTIASSKGDIKLFNRYAELLNTHNVLSYNSGKIKEVNNYLIKIRKTLEKNTDYYKKAFEQNNEVLKTEYSLTLYALSFYTSDILSKAILEINNFEFKTINKIKKFVDTIDSPLYKTYLNNQTSFKDDRPVMKEDVELIQELAWFAIPLIVIGSLITIFIFLRDIVYLWFKIKTKISDFFEIQSQLLKSNIKRLENRKNIDPNKKSEIINKQTKIADKLDVLAEKWRVKYDNTSYVDQTPLPKTSTEFDKTKEKKKDSNNKKEEKNSDIDFSI